MICTKVDELTKCQCVKELHSGLENHLCCGDDKHYNHEWNFTYSEPRKEK